MVLWLKSFLQRAHMSVGGTSRPAVVVANRSAIRSKNGSQLPPRRTMRMARRRPHVSALVKIYRTTYMPSAVSAKSTGRSQNEADAKILAHLRYLIYASCCRVSAGMFDVWCTARAYNALRNQHCRSFDDPGPGGLRHRLSTKNVCVALPGGRVRFAGTASRARRHAASSSQSRQPNRSNRRRARSGACRRTD
jgi:hypothetical protein